MKNQVKKIKDHFDNNRVAYISAGVGVAIGVGGTLVVVNSTAGNAAIQKVIAFKTGDITQNVIQQLARRGHPGLVVHCLETGETFASIRRAAEAMNLDRSGLQRHLNGLKDSVGGFTFEILGEATK